MPKQSIRLNRIKFPQLIRDLRLRHHWLWLVSNHTPLYLLYPSTDIVHVDAARKPPASGVVTRFHYVFIWNNHYSLKLVNQTLSSAIHRQHALGASLDETQDRPTVTFKDGDRRVASQFNTRLFFHSVAHDRSSRLKRNLKFTGAKTLAERNNGIRMRPFHFPHVASGYTFEQGADSTTLLRVRVDSRNLPDGSLMHSVSHDRPGDETVCTSVLSNERKRVLDGLLVEAILRRERLCSGSPDSMQSGNLQAAPSFLKVPSYRRDSRMGFPGNFFHRLFGNDLIRSIQHRLVLAGTSTFGRPTDRNDDITTSPPSGIPKSGFPKRWNGNRLSHAPNSFNTGGFEIDRHVSSRFAGSIPFAYLPRESNRGPFIQPVTSEVRLIYPSPLSSGTSQANALLTGDTGASMQESAAVTKGPGIVANPMRPWRVLAPRHTMNPQQRYGQWQGTLQRSISQHRFDRILTTNNPGAIPQQHLMHLARYVADDSSDAQRFARTSVSSEFLSSPMSLFAPDRILFTESFHRFSSLRQFVVPITFHNRFVNTAQSVIQREIETWKQAVTQRMHKAGPGAQTWVHSEQRGSSCSPSTDSVQSKPGALKVMHAKVLVSNRKLPESDAGWGYSKPTVPGGNSEWLVHRQATSGQAVVTGDPTVFRNDPVSMPRNSPGIENVPPLFESNVSMPGASSSADIIAEKVLAQIVKRIGRRQLNGFADLIYERLVSRMKLEKERTRVR